MANLVVWGPQSVGKKTLVVSLLQQYILRARRTSEGSCYQSLQEAVRFFLKACVMTQSLSKVLYMDIFSLRRPR